MKSGLHAWIDDLMKRHNLKSTQPADTAAYHSYEEFTKRVVGFSRLDHDMRLTRLQAVKKTYKVLGGAEGQMISAGANQNSEFPPLPQPYQHPQEVKPREVDEKYRDVIYACLWSNHQDSIMHVDTKQLVFDADLGGGKNVY